MFKIDRMNSSLLCMVRGKLCITIATVFTFTMVIHMFLFLLVIDQRILSSVVDEQTNKIRGRQIQKRSNAKEDTLGISQDHLNEVADFSSFKGLENDLAGFDSDEIPKDGPAIETEFLSEYKDDLKAQRKILGDKKSVEETLPSGNNKETFHGVKKVLSQIKSNLMHYIPKFSTHEQSQGIDNEPKMVNSLKDTPKNSPRSSGFSQDSHVDEISYEAIIRTGKKVEIQEVNILPNKQDHEWDPTEDWNMDHFIVMETNSKPNSKEIKQAEVRAKDIKQILVNSFHINNKPDVKQGLVNSLDNGAKLKGRSQNELSYLKGRGQKLPAINYNHNALNYQSLRRVSLPRAAVNKNIVKLKQDNNNNGLYNKQLRDYKKDLSDKRIVNIHLEPRKKL